MFSARSSFSTGERLPRVDGLLALSRLVKSREFVLGGITDHWVYADSFETL
jgi:hypothetical protein